MPAAEVIEPSAIRLVSELNALPLSYPQQDDGETQQKHVSGGQIP